MNSTNNLLYTESVSSKKTEALFLILTMFSLALFLWRVNVGSLDGLAALLLSLFLFFLFYSVNYRTLIIRLTSEHLKLRFGIISWTLPINNVEACRLDENTPRFMKFGGAGVHFMVVRKRYRASFNLLEHPRVVIALKKRRGPVRDISFTTQQPDEVVKLVQKAAAEWRAN